MAKLTKAVTGVPAGEVYPRVYEAGEECPPELEAAAMATGALPQRASETKRGK